MGFMRSVLLRLRLRREFSNPKTSSPASIWGYGIAFRSYVLYYDDLSFAGSELHK